MILPSILALDLGTTTGWAAQGANSGRIYSGTISFRQSRYEGGGMRYLRFADWLSANFANQLTVMNESLKPLSAIYFEEVRRHAGTDAAHVYGGMMATLTSWAEQRGIPYQGVPVGTMKLHATGKGNASKAKVIEAVKAKGYNPADDNEADAIALLHWAIDTKGGVA